MGVSALVLVYTMKIKLLPSNVTNNGQLQMLTAFVINDRVTVDAGSLAVALAPEELHIIRHVIVTHTHNDHIASLPVFIAEAYTELDSPIVIYGIAEVLRDLQECIFNDRIFPDFEKIALQNQSGNTIRYQLLEPRRTIEIDGLQVTPVPVNHTVPACGLVVRDRRNAVVFSADTYITDELWEAASAEENLRAVFVDVSYPNELARLAEVSRHFTPQTLAEDLQKLKRPADIYAMHIKPSNRQRVIEQLRLLDNPPVKVAEVNRLYEWE